MFESSLNSRNQNSVVLLKCLYFYKSPIFDISLNKFPVLLVYTNTYPKMLTFEIINAVDDHKMVIENPFDSRLSSNC